jgi:DNA-binding transcriptional regulator YbjK
MTTMNTPLSPELVAPAAAPRARAAAGRAGGGSDRGGRTRELILRATQEIIAAHGLSGVSHRAIAARAQVRLSLTSYHFGSLEDLLEASFDAYRAHTQARRAALLAAAESHIAHFLATPPGADKLPAFAAALADTLARYVRAGVVEHRTDLAVECSFLFAWNLPPTLRAKVDAHSRELVQLAAQVFSRIGSRSAEVDSGLLLACIRQLEFTQVSTGEAASVETLRLTLFRLLLGLLMAGDSMPPA